MDIYNDTVIDIDTYARFREFHSCVIKGCMAANYALYAITAAASLFALIWGIATGTPWMIFLGAALGVVFFRLIYLPHIQPRSKFQKLGARSSVVRYHFLNDGFRTIKDGEDEKNTAVLAYSGARKVYESKTAYYIYYNKTAAYIVNKSGFGSSDDELAFKRRLEASIGKKRIKKA